jgi:hypothetical protein
VVLEVTNMDDAVRWQRLTEKEILFYYHLPVLVLICLKIMRIEGINLNKQFTIYKGGQYLLNIK